MTQSRTVIHKLIERYDYGGAYDLLLDDSREESNAGKIINSCRYGINFDFKTARYHLNILDENVDKLAVIQSTKKNLDELMKGDPSAIFSELLENIKIQIVDEEFIDLKKRYINTFLLVRLMSIKSFLFYQIWCLKRMFLES